MKNFILFFGFLFLANCSESSKSDHFESIVDAKLIEVTTPNNSDKDLMLPSAKDEGNNDQKNIISKKIIKDGLLIIDVSNIKSAKTSVLKLIKKYDGYVQRDDYHNTDTEEVSQLIIRIPNENFDALINSFSDEIGSVSEKNINVKDVTEEYTDVSIRLKNKLIYLDKYRDLLKRSATTKDLLAIQENIRALEEEIESSEGKLRFIDDQVKYSVLNLSLAKEKSRDTITSKIGFGSRFVDSLAQGWNNFVGFFLGLLSFWPFLFIIPFIVFLWRKWKKRKK